jgi:predicted dehydrogenase
MGRFHAAKLTSSPNVDFIGCFDIIPDKAQKVASEFNCKAFKSLPEFIGEVEAVCIAVPTQHHLDSSLPFLENKIAVLLEKPIAPDLDSAEKIVRTARKNNTILQIGHSERFNPVYQAARPKINKPRFVETHRLASFKGRGHDVAVILDLMIHDIDLLLDIIGSEPSSVEAAGVGVITDTLDIVNARLTFPTGCVANITASRISLKEMRKLRVFQKSGYISMDMASLELESFILTEPDSPLAKKAGLFSRFNLPDGRVIVREDIDVPSADNLQLEIDSFIKAVKGQHPPAVSGEAGLSALKVAKHIEQLCIEYQKNL